MMTKDMKIYDFSFLLLLTTINLIGIFSFSVLFHNVDLSYNMCLVANDYHILDYRNWKDIGANGMPTSYTEIYRKSMVMITYLFLFEMLLNVTSVSFYLEWKNGHVGCWQ